jgi:type IV pilus assembly protein PilN
MYSLDVNFLKERQGSTQLAKSSSRRGSGPAFSGDWTPAYIGLAAGLFLPLLGLGWWWWIQQEGVALAEKQATQQTQIDGLQGKLKELDQLNGQVKAAEDEVNSLVAVFDKLKPWSALLQDISNRVPLGLRLEGVKQSKEEVAVAASAAPAASGAPAPATLPRDAVAFNGTAASYEEVNNFVLKLKQSPFFDKEHVSLKKASLVDDPAKPEIVDNKSGLEISAKTRQVVSYEISGVLSETPAPKLLKELEQLGAQGLVARLVALQQEGVLKP